MGGERAKSKIVAIRVDPELWEVFEWYAEGLRVPARSVIRSAVEDVASDILDEYIPDVDMEMPDDVLFKRLRYRFKMRESRGALSYQKPGRGPDRGQRNIRSQRPPEAGD